MKIASDLNMLTTFAKKAPPQMNKEQLNCGLFYVYILLISNWFDYLRKLSSWPFFPSRSPFINGLTFYLVAF